MKQPLMKLVIAASLRLVSASNDRSPMTDVMTLLRNLEGRIKADGILEQRSYDKSACWCEDAVTKKVKEIANEEQQIKNLQVEILDLEGDVGTHGAEIQQLNKDVESNLAAQKEATEVREKASNEYIEEKTESEQSIGALKAAIGVMTGAGTDKQASFLGTSSKLAEFLTVGAGVRRALEKIPAYLDDENSISETDLDAARAFFRHVGHAGHRRNGLGALQVDENPFGDYAPQSTQIQGILKGLLGAFVEGLAKANAEELESQKAFADLIETKKTELATLQQTLQKHQTDHASKSVTKAEKKIERKDVKKQLKADKSLFQDMKASCKKTALDWSVRTRMRAEEMMGVEKAIEILGSEKAKEIFENATSLLQVGSNAHGHSVASGGQKAVAADAQDALAQGHFDKVMFAIDAMISQLRREEQDDIDHRDRCQNHMNKNKNDKEDLLQSKEKAEASVERMESKAKELTDQVASLQKNIDEKKQQMEEALVMRNAAVKSFRKSIFDDTNAVDLLTKALVALTDFYRKNNIPIALEQLKTSAEQMQEPELSDEDIHNAPDLKNYGGRKEDSQPIISMISSIKEDLEKEMKTAREEEPAAQVSYKKQRSAAQDSVEAATSTKVEVEKELAKLLSKKTGAESFIEERGASIELEDKLGSTLQTDCSWLESHFDSRRSARKAEIEGLEDAKNYLAGAEDAPVDF
eukprot:TRINITY_DN97_c0_g1_i1.p1 TRINITY_DN97_c0_g1~~TRINITY_DN97_c0_g1_i1.p1  ORF type:complete len:697 (+),score=187.11 TRINITY_DN97_c0_g1_i1:73-2163(+)